MKKSKSPKVAATYQAGKQENLYCFPEYGVTVSAETIEEARKKFQIIIKEKNNGQ